MIQPEGGAEEGFTELDSVRSRGQPHRQEEQLEEYSFPTLK